MDISPVNPLLVMSSLLCVGIGHGHGQCRAALEEVVAEFWAGAGILALAHRLRRPNFSAAHCLNHQLPPKLVRWKVWLFIFMIHFILLQTRLSRVQCTGVVIFVGVDVIFCSFKTRTTFSRNVQKLLGSSSALKI